MTRISSLGAAAAAAGLDAAAPGGRFRRTVRIDLSTGALATGVELRDGARLAVSFLAREVDALAGNAPERATLTAGSGGVVVAIPVARRIARVRLNPPHSQVSVQAFRFDGPVISEQAVASGAHSPNGAVLGVTDRQLVLRRVGGIAPLASSEITGVFVVYDAPNPRIGLALPDDGVGDEFLSEAVPGSPADALGAAFAAALAARIARFAESRQAPLPNPLAVNLILEADHPCLARIDTFDLDYVLTLQGLADSTEKQRLRFPGGRRAVERVEIRLPPNAVVVAAPIALSESAGPPAQQNAVAGPEEGPATVSSDAMALIPGSLVGTRVLLAEARVVTGAQAQLAAVEDAAVIASLWADDGQGLPGRKLAESAAVMLHSGRPTSIPFVLSPPQTLPAGPAWLVLSVERGRAALALDAAGGGAITVNAGAGFAAVAAAGARGGAARLLYAPVPAENPGPNAGLAVALAGATVALERDGEPDGFRADLAPRLNAMPRPRPERIAIEIASERRSVVTVDPPLFRYEEGA